MRNLLLSVLGACVPLAQGGVRIGSLREGTALTTLAARVVEGEIDPYAAADELIKGL